jgi:hypothetical protein
VREDSFILILNDDDDSFNNLSKDIDYIFDSGFIFNNKSDLFKDKELFNNKAFKFNHFDN